MGVALMLVGAERSLPRDELTLRKLQPPPGRQSGATALTRNGSIASLPCAADEKWWTKADVEYTPSPSLLPVSTQLKVYLNG